MALTVSLNQSVDKNSSIYAGFRHTNRLQWTSLDLTSLPDAETGKNLAQQIIAGKFTGDGG